LQEKFVFLSTKRINHYCKARC